MNSPLKDFVYRRQVALKGGEKELTGRLIGFLEWMETIPLVQGMLEEVRGFGGISLLEEALQDKNDYLNSRHYINLDKIHPPVARTIEQIASVGLGLVEEAKESGRMINDFAWDYGIREGTKTDGGAIRGYVVPFLDYIEQRLPPAPERSRGAKGSEAPPAIIHDSLKRFHTAHRNASRTCFIMMRFGKTPVHAKIETAIKKALKKHGLTGVLARDREFHDDLYANIQTYMHGCEFGIAVFERLETNEFNPNVALEVGYMMGLRKQVLLLKDRTLTALHTDLVGKMYREFDPQEPAKTIPGQLDSWLSDKGLA